MAAKALPEVSVTLDRIALYGDGSRWVAFTAQDGTSITCECRNADLQSFKRMQSIVARDEGVRIVNDAYSDPVRWAVAKGLAVVRGKQDWN